MEDKQKTTENNKRDGDTHTSMARIVPNLRVSSSGSVQMRILSERKVPNAAESEPTDASSTTPPGSVYLSIKVRSSNECCSDLRQTSPYQP